jgi:hypothetical protein
VWAAINATAGEVIANIGIVQRDGGHAACSGPAPARN